MATTHPDLGNAQPAIIAIGAIADFHASTSSTTALGGRSACNNRGIQYGGLAPVTGCGGKYGVPLAADIVTKFYSKWIGCTRPVIPIPRMGGAGGEGEGRQNSNQNQNRYDPKLIFVTHYKFSS